MSNQALIIVDIQNDYFAGGKWTLHNIDNAAVNAAEVISQFRAQNKPVMHVQHIFDDDNAPLFAKDSDGAEIHPSVQPQEGEPLFVKTTINPFVSTNLFDALRKKNISDVVVIGAMSHMCIDATARAAADLGLKVTVIEDACASKDLEFNGEIVPADQVHKAYMSALGFAYAKVVSTSEWLSI